VVLEELSKIKPESTLESASDIIKSEFSELKNLYNILLTKKNSRVQEEIHANPVQK